MRSVKRRRINVIESESEESNDALNQIQDIQTQHTPKVGYRLFFLLGLRI